MVLSLIHVVWWLSGDLGDCECNCVEWIGVVRQWSGIALDAEGGEKLLG